MLLHKVLLDLRCKEARRDIADPYEMHSTLCRAFSIPEKKCPSGTFLWRLEPENSNTGMPIVIVQSSVLPDWTRILVADWFAEKPFSPINIEEKLKLKIENLAIGKRFRFRIRANPSICRKGKRYGLYKPEEQENWLLQQGKLKGFLPETVHRSQELMLTGNRRADSNVKVFSVLYNGVLQVTDPKSFIEAVSIGIGHGKTMGLGLLSVVPIR